VGNFCFVGVFDPILSLDDLRLTSRGFSTTSEVLNKVQEDHKGSERLRKDHNSGVLIERSSKGLRSGNVPDFETKILIAEKVPSIQQLLNNLGGLKVRGCPRF
jgi:hypothetical protein